jgi:EipB-like
LKITAIIFIFCIFSNQNVYSAPINLASHRAVYDLSLLKTGQEKQISEANGRIALEFSGSECAGFNYISRQITNMSNGEGENKRIDMRVYNFENATGRVLKFKTVMRDGNRKITQAEGSALRDEGGELSINLHRPRQLKLDLDAKAVFPTAHMRALIDAAQNGERFFITKIYDGSENGLKIFDVVAVIGSPIVAGSDLRVDDVMRKAGLVNMKRWPVHLSYYEKGDGERLPTYQLKYDLFENGITTSLIYDFTNFSLKSTLVHMEMLPEKACGKLIEK